MSNGTTMTINNTDFEIGKQFIIAGNSYEVYNTMPELKMIGFARLNKDGRRATVSSAMTLTTSQIASLMIVGSM